MVMGKIDKSYGRKAEYELLNYFLQALKIYLVLTPKNLRRLAYEVREANTANKVQNLISNKM